ncbi:hypothetical protein ACFS27_24960 [Promicromonospora vindobonensis]|uniref:Uncharacterized protein n=1 Tax=Promicromonospora vindobonensis TaxID=195748 RepID=A0ABW5VZ90_9MICO
MRAFTGPIPTPPPPGRFERPAVPEDVERHLESATTRARRSVLDPLARERGTGTVGFPRRLNLPSLDGTTAAAVQVDETTCGSAVLAMLGLAGDPRAALRLAGEDPASRFVRLQHAVQAATNRRGLIVAGWPRTYGTPPWGAARFASYGGVRYTHRVAGSRALLEAAVASARAGIPVPLYTGGDVTGGWGSAVPRHVVLLTLADGEGTDGSAVLYEPSGAGLHTVPVAALLDPPPAPSGGAEMSQSTGERTAARVRKALTAALGGWPHIAWVLLPERAGRWHADDARVTMEAT